MIFRLAGIPVAQQRPRALVKNGKIRMYNPQNAIKKETSLRIKSQMRREDILQGAVVVSFRFLVPAPKKIKAQGGSPCTGVPDIDNMIKFYLDCMTGIVYEDDRQVTNLDAWKRYCFEPDMRPATIIEVMTSI